MKNQSPDSSVLFPGLDPVFCLEADLGGPPPSSSLESIETNDGCYPSPQTEAQLRLHSRYWDQRQHIIYSLDSAQTETLVKRALRLSQCRHSPIVWETEDGQVHVQLQACRDRLCPTCQNQRSHKAREQLEQHIMAMNAPKFFTFTIANTAESLAENNQRLRDAWRLMRQRPSFKEACKGGIYAVEVTQNQQSKQWHSHIHIVADCAFIPQHTLSKEWAEASGGSPIVWVKAIHDAHIAAKYLGEYISKPMDIDDWTPEAICEYATAMHGKRMIHTFGSHHNMPLIIKIDEHPPTPTRYVAPLRLAAEAAGVGDVRGEKAMQVIRFGPRQLQQAAGLHTDRSTPHCEQLPPRLARLLIDCLHSLFLDYIANKPFGPHALLPTPNEPPLGPPPSDPKSNTDPASPPPGQLFATKHKL